MRRDGEAASPLKWVVSAKRPYHFYSRVAFYNLHH